MYCTVDGILVASEKEMFVSVSEGWKFYSIAGGAKVHSSEWQLEGQFMTSRDFIISRMKDLHVSP